MKITCSKCGKGIDAEVYHRFDSYQVGNVTCPYCKEDQPRYISESDLLLYLFVIELLYTILTIVVGYAFDGFNIILVIIAAIVLIASLFLQRRALVYIYQKPPYKKAYANAQQNEDTSKIKKGINIQYSIFILLAFISIVYAEKRIELIWLLVVDVIISLLRYILAIRKEINK